MMNFLVKTIANAGALAVAVWVLDKITLTGDSTGKKVGTLLLVALVFGLVNALMLLLTSWLADKLDLSFHVEGFWTAVLGGLIISVVSWALNVVLPDGD
jgi:putative membrane protein